MGAPYCDATPCAAFMRSKVGRSAGCSCSTVSVRLTQGVRTGRSPRCGDAGRESCDFGELAYNNPGRIASKYSRAETLSLRHDSTTERMAATFGPDLTLPTCSQFFRLCAIVHKRNYVRPVIMCSPRELKA